MNEQLPVQLSFDISLAERAQRIRNLVGVARTCIIEIGRELIAAKAQVGHGDWMPWLEEEFGWSVRTADNYMLVSRKFAGLANLDGLEITGEALVVLSGRDVPQEARDEAVAQAEAGEHVTKAECRGVNC